MKNQGNVLTTGDKKSGKVNSALHPSSDDSNNKELTLATNESDQVSADLEKKLGSFGFKESSVILDSDINQ